LARRSAGQSTRRCRTRGPPIKFVHGWPSRLDAAAPHFYKFAFGSSKANLQKSSDLFNASGLQPRSAFKIEGEQIDGSFVLGNDIYLLEAKWTSKNIGKPDLVVFNNKVTSKSGFTRGLFISYFRYTDEAIKTLAIGTTVKIILMTVEELAISLQQNRPLSDVLGKKVRALAEEGKYYKHIMEL